jgi:hypothetical protein
MLNGVIVLQSFVISSGGALGDFFSKWEEAGLFSYLLPFLLIFALVFGILTRVQIFKDNRVVNGIIALAVALMALQFDFVPSFFSQIFPRLGVALAIILGLMIIVGLFMDPNSNLINYFLLGIGVITVGIVLIQSAGAVGWQSGTWWQDNWQLVIGAIVLFILVAVIIGSATPKKERGPPPQYNPSWTR